MPKPGHLQLGCDVARFGDDATVIHVRLDDTSLHHESYRKRDTAFTAERLKELCREYAPLVARPPWHIPCLIDDTGVGGGVVDQRHSPPTEDDLRASNEDTEARKGRYYWFVPVNAGQAALDPEKYPNARSECLFLLAERLAQGRCDLSKLPRSVQEELKRQALQITYKLDAIGRRVVERKDVTKDRIHRSPDDLDGACLSYYGLVFQPGPSIAIPRDSIWGRASGDRLKGQSPRGPQERPSRRRTTG